MYQRCRRPYIRFCIISYNEERKTKLINDVLDDDVNDDHDDDVDQII